MNKSYYSLYILTKNQYLEAKCHLYNQLGGFDKISCKQIDDGIRCNHLLCNDNMESKLSIPDHVFYKGILNNNLEDFIEYSEYKGEDVYVCKQDIYNLNRFLKAHLNGITDETDPKGKPLDRSGESYKVAILELENGSKQLDWVWYVFPLIDGLGSSSTNKYFSIKNLDEAVVYLRHDLLKYRYLESITLLNGAIKKKLFNDIVGGDKWKIIASATLFMIASNINININNDIYEACKQLLNSSSVNKIDTATIQIIKDTDIENKYKQYHNVKNIKDIIQQYIKV